MPIICRLLELSPEQATFLSDHPENLAQVVEEARIYSDVYRYWHAIQYLLTRRRPDSPAANWLGLGQAVSTATPEIPASRLLLPQEIAQLDAVLQDVEPDDLIPHYEAADLDQASIYPCRWEVWEETFDPLGQVLEHYWFLKNFVKQCASRGDALLLYFVDYDDGTDDTDDDDDTND